MSITACRPDYIIHSNGLMFADNGTQYSTDIWGVSYHIFIWWVDERKKIEVWLRVCAKKRMRCWKFKLCNEFSNKRWCLAIISAAGERHKCTNHSIIKYNMWRQMTWSTVQISKAPWKSRSHFWGHSALRRVSLTMHIDLNAAAAARTDPAARLDSFFHLSNRKCDRFVTELASDKWKVALTCRLECRSPLSSVIFDRSPQQQQQAPASLNFSLVNGDWFSRVRYCRHYVRPCDRNCLSSVCLVNIYKVSQKLRRMNFFRASCSFNDKLTKRSLSTKSYSSWSRPTDKQNEHTRLRRGTVFCSSSNKDGGPGRSSSYNTSQLSPSLVSFDRTVWNADAV